MQGDNNLVLYRDATPIWGASGTWGNEPGSFLKMENDGRAIVYKPTPIWYTNYPPKPPLPPLPPCESLQVGTEQAERPICPL